MSRILVTGADGFTGRHLIALLSKRGHEVHALVRRALPSEDPLHRASARIHVAELSDPTALKDTVDSVRPHGVVHLAAIAFVAHGDVDAIYSTNLLGTRNLLVALASGAATPDAVMLASSANVYGNADGGVIDETIAPSPMNDYAVSKLAMEHMARTWASRLPIQIVRPFNYTGVGQSERFVLAKIVAHFRRRAEELELGNLDVERDFSDVRTVVDCYRRLLERGGTGSPLNVCSGVGYSLSQVLDIMERLVGYRPRVSVNPEFVRANEVRRLVGSKVNLEAAIGPVDCCPLEETLAWMCGA
jgi:nucleoside-diphosphate-sugar epimerase